MKAVQFFARIGVCFSFMILTSCGVEEKRAVRTGTALALSSDGGTIAGPPGGSTTSDGGTIPAPSSTDTTATTTTTDPASSTTTTSPSTDTTTGSTTPSTDTSTTTQTAPESGDGIVDSGTQAPAPASIGSDGGAITSGSGSQTVDGGSTSGDSDSVVDATVSEPVNVVEGEVASDTDGSASSGSDGSTTGSVDSSVDSSIGAGAVADGGSTSDSGSGTISDDSGGSSPSTGTVADNGPTGSGADGTSDDGATQSSSLVEYALIAGQHYNVGTVTVDYDGDKLIVVIKVLPGIVLGDTHVNVVGDLGDLSSAPGSYPYKHQVANGTSEYRYEINLSPLGLDPAAGFFVAVHAVVSPAPGHEGEILAQQETAWGNGIRFGRHGGWRMACYYER